MPPDQDSIEELEHVLRIPCAHNFFWNYLEQMDKLGSSDIDTNNFRLLSLYTDMRFYDIEVRKIANLESAKDSVLSHEDLNAST